MLAQDTFLLIMSLGNVGRQAASCREQPVCTQHLCRGLPSCRRGPRGPCMGICPRANAFGKWSVEIGWTLYHEVRVISQLFFVLPEFFF